VYLPDQHRTCGIDGCTEDSYVACKCCPNFLCFDHMQTSCDVHCNSTVISVLSEDTDNTESGSNFG